MSLRPPVGQPSEMVGSIEQPELNDSVCSLDLPDVFGRSSKIIVN